MATHQLSLNECNTPWWYETPSLASQSTFSSNTYCTGTSQIDPFDITPSQSSGYYDEETTASEASSNMFTGGTGSCATCSEWSGADSASVRSASKSTRTDHHRAMEGASGSERGGSRCEHCGNHGARGRVHHGQSSASTDGGYDTRASTKTAENSETFEVMIAPISLTVDTTMPLSAFSSSEISEVGPTPSTCTELNGQGESQEISDDENQYNGEYYDSSKLSETDYRESQLSHSMASTNQQILRDLGRDLMQHIDSIKLFPYLQQNSLLSDDDVDYICNPRRTEKERRRRIIISAPSSDPDAFDRFIDCLSVEQSHSGHAYLAKRMREAIKRKRENPFKTMSSLRNKKTSSGRHHSESDAHVIRKQPNEVHDQQSSSVHSSPRYRHRRNDDEMESRRSPPSKSQSPNVRESRRASISYRDQISPPQVPPRSSRGNSSTTVTADSAHSPVFSPRHVSPSTVEVSSTSTTTQATVVNSNYATSSPGHQYYSRRSPSGSPGSTNYIYTQPMNRPSYDHQDPTLATEAGHQEGFYDNYKQEDYDNYNQPGGYSSLPRHFSNSMAGSLSRGSPAYSSARYEAEHKRKSKSLNRHGSFHTHNDTSAQLVSPLTRSTAPCDNTVVTTHQQQPYTYDYPRKYSLPITSQQSTSYTASGKSHSGSQLPNIRNSPYPPLHEDVGDGQISNPSTTQRDYVVSESSVSEYGFPTFYSQWVPSENQYATTHHHQQQSSSHQYQSVSPSFNESRSRHPSLPRDQDIRMMSNDHSLYEMSDLQGSIEELSLGGRQSVERTHRRSRSCDASKAKREGLVPLPYEEVKSRHHSLIRRPQYEEVERERLIGKETGDAKLIRRKLLWLQERVHFTDFSEELNFLSLTHYHEPRTILYSGTLYEHGKPRFLVLLTDMLLILKPRKKLKMNMVQSKLGVQLPQLDWFSDLGCKTKRPLFLHLMMVQRKPKKYNSECFSIRYNNHSEMVEVTLQAVSREAKEIWVESLSQAIKVCTEDHANSILPVGNPTTNRRSSDQSYSKLTLMVLQANNLAISTSNCKTRNHYCSVELAGHKCRTPSVKAKCWPSWNSQSVFCDFPLTEVVEVAFFAERTTCPDDFLGNIEIELSTLVQSQRRQVSADNVSKLVFKNQAYPLMNGKGTLSFDIDLSWETNM